MSTRCPGWWSSSARRGSLYADSVGAPALLDPPAPVAGGVDGDRARALAYAVLDQLRLPLAERQHVLEAVTTSERLQELVARVRREVG